MKNVERIRPQRKGIGGLDDQVLGSVYDHRVVVRLLKYAIRYKRPCFIAILGMAGFIFTMVAQPLIIAWGIDSFVVGDDPQNAFGSIDIVAAVFVVNAVVNMVSNYLQYSAMARISVGVLYSLRTDMFSHLQLQSSSFYDHSEVGRIMSRVQNDVFQLQEFMEIGVITLGDMVMLIFIVAVVIIMNPVLAAVALLGLPLLVTLMLIWQRFARSAFVKVRIAISIVNASLQENISGVRVSQSMNRQQINLQNFDKLNTDHRDAALRAAFLSALMSPIVEVLTVVSMGLVVIVGGKMVFDETLEIGLLVAFLLYIQRLFEPIRTLAMQYTQFQRAMASGARIFELLDLEPDLMDAQDATVLPHIQGEIKYQGVSFFYEPGKNVLDDINLDIQPGQTVALVGMTGAGKTTIVSLLARFYDVTSGSITVDGYDIRNIQRESLAGQMSMVLQEPFLYSTTVKENIRYRHENITDEQVIEAAKLVGAHEFIMKLDNGYDTMLQQRGGNLSIGQRQLVSFARALVADPRILILDEATASIDSHTEHLIQEALKTVLIGRTSIVIAHRLSTITSANKIVVLEHGRIKEIGTHEELLSKGALYANLYSMNFGETLTGSGGDDSQESAGADQILQAGSEWQGSI